MAIRRVKQVIFERATFLKPICYIKKGRGAPRADWLEETFLDAHVALGEDPNRFGFDSDDIKNNIYEQALLRKDPFETNSKAYRTTLFKGTVIKQWSESSPQCVLVLIPNTELQIPNCCSNLTDT